MIKKIAMLMLLPVLSLASEVETITLTKENTINFNQAFTSKFVAQKQLEAINLCSKNPNSTINIVLYSPGGSISAGQRFIDTLNALDCTFNTITLFSASMAYQTVQNLGTRYIVPSGILMSHRASVSGLSGEIGGELDATINRIKQTVNELETVASNRVGISLKNYQDLISDELWLTATNAVKTNHADKIALVKCDESLMGTTVQSIATIFGTFRVEFSTCPIVTAPLRIAPASNESSVGDFLNYYSNITKYTYFIL
jgi:ATP-dependent protease ClpP protease subunit